MTTRAEIAVLGGGLLGRLTALALRRQGRQVALYDAAGPAGEGAAAFVAAGMITPMAEAAVADNDIVAMGFDSLARWPQLLATLTRPVFYQHKGTVVVWHRQEQAEAHQFVAMVRQHSLTGQKTDSMQRLDAAGLAAHAPSLADRFSEGLYLPDEGQVDNRQVLAALADTLAAEGVTCHWQYPVDDTALPPAGLHIDCRGLGAKARWPGLRGVRGEVLRLYAPDVQLGRMVRLLHPRYSLYLVPRANGRVVMGATTLESEDMSPMSVRSALEMLSAAYAVHPGFAEARIEEMSTQCRPALPDNNPAIRVQLQTGQTVIAANGLYRHGFLLAPVVADELAALVRQLDNEPDAQLAFARQHQQTAWPALYGSHLQREAA
ncbi:FAD-dependent oxidoreductase [Leeia oryzae]|uniref:FAD-dependent oxidoreductase n=1 Tax=Leeia oryzae TaxID=356662 RepID=UPI000362E1A6|nr:FAD-dependent oxidoreductase [Leeia oryzae]